MNVGYSVVRESVSSCSDGLKWTRAMLRACFAIGVVGLLFAGCSWDNEAEMKTMAHEGHTIYAKMMDADYSRSVDGRPSLWPSSTETRSADSSDIAGMVFNTATEYFYELTDCLRRNNYSWNPYLELDFESLFRPYYSSEQPEIGYLRSRWSIAQGVNERTSRDVPVLVSENIDVGTLLTSPGTFNTSSEEFSRRMVSFSGKYAVIITKGGVALCLSRPISWKNLYKGMYVCIPEGFSYLRP